MLGSIVGVTAISAYIDQHFSNQKTLVTMYDGDLKVMKIAMILDRAETDFRRSEKVRENSSEMITDGDRDRLARSLVLNSSADHTDRSETASPTKVRFVLDDPGAFKAEINEDGDVYLWAGGDRSMSLSKLDK